MSLKFTKMHGIGNDYVYVDCFKQQIENPGELAKKISSRHFGIGSDGLVLIMPSKTADARMRMFNADGSEAEMCGNATRCVGKFLYCNDIVKKDTIMLETGAGIKAIKLVFKNNKVWGATVDMGEPILAPAKIPVITNGNEAICKGLQLKINNNVFEITAVSMGNPHAVLFMDDIDLLDLPELGPQFEHHPAFPNRINTEFVEVISKNKFRMRVWERGAGETLACGTGACAALVACCLNGLTERKAEAELKGGILNIEWDEKTGHVLMTGPAETVFTGEYGN